MPRVAVGPDEAFDGNPQEEMEASHWAFLPPSSAATVPTSKCRHWAESPHDVVLGTSSSRVYVTASGESTGRLAADGRGGCQLGLGHSAVT
jgi:hypothetical protein